MCINKSLRERENSGTALSYHSYIEEMSREKESISGDSFVF